jgi:hypothetical protein
MNLPDSNFLPAPLWLITGLHILTLSLHFAAMNFMLGGILIALAANRTRHRDNPVVRRLLALLPSAMAATVTLGIAPLLFLQLVYPRQMYAAAIVSGWFWLLVIPAVILAYYFVYAAAFCGKTAASRGAGFLWPALPCLLYVSLLYSSVFSLAERPDLMMQLYRLSQSGLQGNPEVGYTLLRWLHMILGAVAVGGFFASLLGKDDPGLFSACKRICAYGMGAAAAAGLAYLLSLGEDMSGLLRGTAAGVLTAGVGLSLVSLHLLFRRRFLFSALTLLASLVLMVITRHDLRLGKLEGQFDPAAWRTAPQWPPFFLFAASLAVAGMLIAYMLHLHFRRHPQA